MSPDAGAPFKATWPVPTSTPTPDIDLKRPGRVAPQTREALLRGATEGPPARPRRRRRRGLRA